MFNELNPTAGKYDYKPTHENVFYSLSEFYNVTNDANEKATYRIHGVFFFDTQYGQSAALIGDECYIYVPKNMVTTFAEIDKDVEKSNALMNGLCGFKMNKYKAHGKECTGIKLVDISADFEPTNGIQYENV